MVIIQTIKPSDVWSLKDNYRVTINSIAVENLDPSEFSTFEQLMTETASLLSQILAMASSAMVLEEPKGDGFDPYEGDEVLRKEVNDSYLAKPLSQEDRKALKISNLPPFPEKDAEFVGGSKGLQSFINANVIYPNEALNKDVSDKVEFFFVVNSDGIVSHACVYKSVHESFDK